MERHNAYRVLDGDLSRMSLQEQEGVRDPGHLTSLVDPGTHDRTLARLHDALYGPFGEPEDNREAREAWGRGAGGGGGREATDGAIIPRSACSSATTWTPISTTTWRFRPATWAPMSC